MAPLAVVKNLNVFLDRCLGMGTRFIMLVMCQFIFQAAPEAFIWTSPVCQDISYAFTQVRLQFYIRPWYRSNLQALMEFADPLLISITGC